MPLLIRLIITFALIAFIIYLYKKSGNNKGKKEKLGNYRKKNNNRFKETDDIEDIDDYIDID